MFAHVSNKNEVCYNCIDDRGLQATGTVVQLKQINDEIVIFERGCPILDADLDIKKRWHYHIVRLKLKHSNFFKDSTLIIPAKYKTIIKSQRSGPVVKTKEI